MEQYDNDTGQVIYSSSVEQVLSLSLIYLPAAVSLMSQALVILTIIRSPSLHNAHFYIVVSCCLADVLLTLISTGMYTLMFTRGQQEWFCRGRVLYVITVVLFHATTLKVAVVAYERFVYFVKPFEYPHKFTSYRVACYVAVPYISSALYVAVTDWTHGREFHASALSCYLPYDPYLLAAQFGLFFTPPTIMSMLSVGSVLRLTRRISPCVTSSGSGATPVQQIRRTVRMILLMSGAFWAAILPGQMVRLVTFTSGITWTDMDSRRDPLAAMCMRLATWMYVCLPPAINPLIYLYSRRDLRTAMAHFLFNTAQN